MSGPLGSFVYLTPETVEFEFSDTKIVVVWLQQNFLAYDVAPPPFFCVLTKLRKANVRFVVSV